MTTTGPVVILWNRSPTAKRCAPLYTASIFCRRPPLLFRRARFSRARIVDVPTQSAWIGHGGAKPTNRVCCPSIEIALIPPVPRPTYKRINSLKNTESPGVAEPNPSGAVDLMRKRYSSRGVSRRPPAAGGADDVV